MNSIYLFLLITLGIIIAMFLVAGRLAKLQANIFFIGVFATIVGLLIGTLAYLPLRALPGAFGQYLPIIFYFLAVTLSIWLFLVRKNVITGALENVGKLISILSHPSFQLVENLKLRRIKPQERKIIVDTSVLIDGRILDIAKARFIPGVLIIPQFVLSELQHIADSDDALRRNKGRRGLDIVQDLKKELKGKLEFTNQDSPEVNAVDDKLLELAQKMSAEIITNDFNLNKIAKVNNINVLNINELAQALRPVIIPGEEIEIKVVQAGKEKHQGIGYLPDGTMIVVEEGDKIVGKSKKVIIKRVLQTTAGKMYFATLKDND